MIRLSVSRAFQRLVASHMATQTAVNVCVEERQRRYMVNYFSRSSAARAPLTPLSALVPVGLTHFASSNEGRLRWLRQHSSRFTNAT